MGGRKNEKRNGNIKDMKFVFFFYKKLITNEKKEGIQN